MFNFERFRDDFHVAGGSRAYARTVAVWSRAGEMLGRAPVASREPVGARQAGRWGRSRDIVGASECPVWSGIGKTDVVVISWKITTRREMMTH